MPRVLLDQRRSAVFRPADPVPATLIPICAALLVPPTEGTDPAPAVLTSGARTGTL